MTRPLHRLTGLILGLFLTVTALSGAALAVFPAVEAWMAPALPATAAELVAAVTKAQPGVEEIAVSASGQVTAYTAEGGVLVDAMTGQALAVAAPQPWLIWLENLHRALFLADTGRIAVAGLAAAMLGMCVTGALLLARRAGGWRGMLAVQKGQGWGWGRLHAEVARLAALGLILSSLSGLWMTAASFDLLPTSAGAEYPAVVSGRAGAALPLDFPAADLRGLTLPGVDQPATLTTVNGEYMIDQGTGAVLTEAHPTWADRITAWAGLLHTGRGAALLGLILGLAALTTPFLALSGVLMRPLSRPLTRPRSFAAAGQAETVILVGSEGGATWGFAQTLASALKGPVHLAALQDFAPEAWPRARRLLILTATYGDGAAPASARGFLDRLAAAKPTMPLAVLGFGDRSFPRFCAYAEEVARVAKAGGWPQLAALATVDRQSGQDFARWGDVLGAALGQKLTLTHQTALPATQSLILTARRDYGQALQMPAAILRFALPERGLWARLTGQGAFQPGDLLGVIPQGSTLPRFYSLGSGTRDGFAEICIRRHEGGLCSGQLHALAPGDQVQAFIRPNPAFHAGRRPLILIGAGTGIGPLAGFIRHARRPVHLFFGLRHRDHDFYHQEDLEDWQSSGRLTGLTLAFSRGGRPHYVQDALRDQAVALRASVTKGARIMVCGGREMGQGVRLALTEILAPLGLSPDQLAKEGRYAEDIY